MQRRITVLFMIVSLFMGITSVMAQGHGDQFYISNTASAQAFPKVEYNPNADVYLAAWEDERNSATSATDIYAQLISGDGTLIGANFPVCSTAGAQYWPHIAVDPINDLFLVVFEDQRNDWQHGDVRGVFVDTEGNLVDAPTSDEDHSFGISTNEGHIYTCSVAFNYIEEKYLVVWGDNRNNPEFNYGGVDVYGQLVTADGSLQLPDDATVNFPIDSSSYYDASVPDVTYNAITNEFFVVYGTSIHYVLGQRVNSTGQLVNPDGTLAGSLAKTATLEPAMFVSLRHHDDNSPDCLQSRVTSRIGFEPSLLAKTIIKDSTEVQAVWKGMKYDLPEENKNDVYGQRIRFILENGVYVAKYVSLDNTVTELTEPPSNFAISLQPGWADPPEVAYSDFDDEYLVAWGDPRDEGMNKYDMYMQRLWLNDDDQMIFLADDRMNTVTNTENIPLANTMMNETSIDGIAYNKNVNEFLVVYEFGSYDDANSVDVVAKFVYGSELPTAANVVVLPATAEVLPGETQQFTAQVLDSEENEIDLSVVWSCTGGTIDASGLFTAGTAPGSYMVTAEEPNSGVSGTASVTVLDQTGVSENEEALPKEYALARNFPNPFNPSTQIGFAVKAAGRVRINLFDVQGKEVSVLVDAPYSPGYYQTRFDASQLSSGVYFYKLQVNDFTDVKKMILMR